MRRHLPAERRPAPRTMRAAAAPIVLASVVGSVALANDTSAAAGHRASDKLEKEGFLSLFDGKLLGCWDLKPWHQGHWVAHEGVLDYDGAGEHPRK